MAAYVGYIKVGLEMVGSEKFSSDMRTAGSIVEQQSGRISRSVTKASQDTAKMSTALSSVGRSNAGFNALASSALRADSSIGRLTNSLYALTASVGGLSGAFAVRVLTDYADTATTIRNRIASVVAETKQQAAAEQGLFEIAQRSRSSYAATASLFARMTLSSKELKASQSDILRVVETTQKALVVGGSTVSESASVATQLSQALGSGRGLSGDELRSLSENAPVLVQAIAKEFGVGVGKLKEMGAAGELAADRVFKAILNASKDVEEAFARTAPTVQAGIQQIDNALTRYLGNVDKSLGASQALANGLKYVADNLENIGDAAAVAVAAVGGAMTARLLGKGGAAVLTPFRQARDAAATRLDEIRKSASLADERLVDAGMATQAVRRRARQDPESFVGKDLLRDRKRLAAELVAANQELQKAQDRYQEIASGFQKADVALANRDLSKIMKSPALAAQRKEFDQAQRELKRAQAEMDRLSDATPARANQLQERLNKNLEREEELRRRIQNVAFQERQRLPEDVADLSQARVPKLTAEREKLERQLKATLDDTKATALQLASAEQDLAEKRIVATNRVAEAKNKALQAEQALTAAAQQASQRQAVADRTGVVRALAPAEADRIAAQQKVLLTQDLLNETNKDISRQAAARSSQEITAALQKQQVAAQAAAHGMAELAKAQSAASRASSLLGVLGQTAGVARTAFTGLVGLMGGPFGAALTALSAGLIGYEIYQARATRAAEEHATALSSLGQRMKEIEDARRSGQTRTGSDIIFDQATLQKAKAGMQDLREEFLSLQNQIAPQVANKAGIRNIKGDIAASLGLNFTEITRGLSDTSASQEEAQRSAEGLILVLERLGQTRPDLSPAIAEALRAGRAFLAAQQQVGSFIQTLQQGNAATSSKAVYDSDPNIAIDAKIDRIAGAQRDMIASDPTLRLPSAEEITKQIQDEKKLGDRITDAKIRQRTDRASRLELHYRQLREQFPNAAEGDLRQLADLEVSEDKKPRKSESERDAEKLADKLKDLGQDAAVAGLAQLDQQTVRFAQSANVAAENVDAFIKALQSGDLSSIPPEMAQIREELEKLEASKFARGLLDEVFPARKMAQELEYLRTAAATMPEVAANLDVLEEKIKASNAPDWAKNAADAFGDFAKTAILDFENIGQAAENLAMKLAEVAVEAAIIAPLKQSLTAAFSGGGTGSDPIGGIIGSIFGGFGGGGGTIKAGQVHTGGRISATMARPRQLTLGQVATAPRFHSGLTSKEFPAVLEFGERVLTEKMDRRTTATIAGLAAATSQEKPQVIQPQVNIINPPMEPQTQTNSDGSVDVIFEMAEQRMSDRAVRGKGSLAKAMSARANNQGLIG